MKVFAIVTVMLMMVYSNAISAQINDEKIGNVIKCDVAKEMLAKKYKQFVADRNAPVVTNTRRASQFSKDTHEGDI